MNEEIWLPLISVLVIFVIVGLDIWSIKRNK